MSERSKKGVTVYVNHYGDRGETEICFECGWDTDTQWQCPFCMADFMPPEEGARCFAKEYCECHSTAARYAALQLMRNEIDDAIYEIENAEE